MTSCQSPSLRQMPSVLLRPEHLSHIPSFSHRLDSVNLLTKKTFQSLSNRQKTTNNRTITRFLLRLFPMWWKTLRQTPFNKFTFPYMSAKTNDTKQKIKGVICRLYSCQFGIIIIYKDKLCPCTNFISIHYQPQLVSCTILDHGNERLT